MRKRPIKREYIMVEVGDYAGIVALICGKGSVVDNDK